MDKLKTYAYYKKKRMTNMKSTETFEDDKKT